MKGVEKSKINYSHSYLKGHSCKADSPTYGHLNKTPFEFYSWENHSCKWSKVQLRTLSLLREGVRLQKLQLYLPWNADVLVFSLIICSYEVDEYIMAFTVQLPF